MEERAAQLKEDVQDRLGDSLRAVGFQTETETEVEYIRDDLVDQYPSDTVEEFIRSSRGVHRELRGIDEGMGTPVASLHLLEEGLIAQFHYPDERVAFLAMEREVGRNCSRFMKECRSQMAKPTE